MRLAGIGRHYCGRRVTGGPRRATDGDGEHDAPLSARVGGFILCRVTGLRGDAFSRDFSPTASHAARVIKFATAISGLGLLEDSACPAGTAPVPNLAYFSRPWSPAGSGDAWPAGHLAPISIGDPHLRPPPPQRAERRPPPRAGLSSAVSEGFIRRPTPASRPPSTTHSPPSNHTFHHRSSKHKRARR